ncbi:MAG: hypothetical protein H6607_12735 [Flavobacteriales bacterium]|nr:hypothetical protein [Flavobacteriales bacterium]
MIKLKFSLFAIVALFVSSSMFTSCGPDKGDDTPIFTPDTEFTTSEIKDDAGVVLETIITIKDNGKGIGTMTLTNDKTWVLNGLVFVNEGQTLTINPGTVIKGKSGQGENASALIVARGAKIMAEGTAAEPIIFTSEADKLDGSMAPSTRGLWGGLIVLGKAGLNSTPGYSSIEGIPTSETRGVYGGSDDADNSGVLRYISIRHGGTDIGAGNEINGLSLGGVGSGTIVDHIEVVGNADDAVELFGGTVNIKYMALAYCGDDNIDYDEGWRGKAQFIFVQQDPSLVGDRGGEHDGGTDPEDGTPYALPVFSNCTYIGHGNSRAVTFRDNAGGEYHNSIFVNWKHGIDIEDLDGDGEDSKKRLDAGQLKVVDNIFHMVEGSDLTKIILSSKGDNLEGGANTSGNKIANPGLTAGVPSGDVSGASDLSADPFFTKTTYKGAFEPGKDAWIKGWTEIDALGLVK